MENSSNLRGKWTRPELVCLTPGTDKFERAKEKIAQEMALTAKGRAHQP